VKRELGESVIDLRQLILRIDKNKNIPTHLCLDLNCKIQGEESTPLLRAINYILNYLRLISDKEIQIDLDAHASKYQLVFIVHTDHEEIPGVSDALRKALPPYRAKLEFIHEPKKYVKFQLTFDKALEVLRSA
jgi:hypothetical protein